MYTLPQEIEVWYVIPAIRKELARIFTSKYKLTFEKAGEILGISKAAVSQYLSNKRASSFKLQDKCKKEIEKSAEIIIKDSNKSVMEIERILRFMRNNKCSCKICKKHNPKINKFCECHPC